VLRSCGHLFKRVLARRDPVLIVTGQSACFKLCKISAVALIKMVRHFRVPAFQPPVDPPTRYPTPLNFAQSPSSYAMFHSKKTRKRKTINSPSPSKTGPHRTDRVRSSGGLAPRHGSVYSQGIASEAQHGLISQVLKDIIFRRVKNRIFHT